MDGPGQVSFAFPRPGRALTAVLAVVAVFGVLGAFLLNWVPPLRDAAAYLVCTPEGVAQWQLWRLLTSALLVESPTHLITTLLGLYFLAPDLEKRWGGGRFLRFLALSIVAGNLLVLAVDRVPVGDSAFHPGAMLGAYAAVTAIAIAWSRENADTSVMLFFFLPVKGRYLFWATIGLCVLDLIFRLPLAEGMLAPFGGVIVGVLLAGTPSPLRTIYLRMKLAFIRRRRGSLRVDDVLHPPTRPMSKRRSSSSPPLRIVQGGLDDVLRNRKPPKDKRYLN